MTKLTIVANITAETDKIDFVKAELEKLIAPTRAEDGCLQYDLHQDLKDPAHFLFFENWETRAHLEAHMETDHFKNFGKVTDGAIAAFTLNEMNQIG